MLTENSLERALEALGRLLEGRGLTFELVAVGGSSLMLLGLITRPTADLDIVALVRDGHYVKVQELPPPLRDAATEIAGIFQLGQNWVNPGPADLLDFGLPDGFAERTVKRRFGGLTLHVASRFDQIALKVYAATDQGPGSKHHQDLQMLDPTRDELSAGARWAITHDPSEGFRGQLTQLLSVFGVADADRLL